MKANKQISNQVVWIYCSKNDQNFYSTIGGSEQRLPNGNTLICSDTQGHFFEVTAGDTLVVWEYINPVTKDGIKTVFADQYPMYNSVFRAARYSADHPAFKGRTLTRTKTLTGKTPQYFKPSDLLAVTNNDDVNVPDNCILYQNYPNPFNPSTVIRYRTVGDGMTSLRVYDALGREVATLVNETQHAGTYAVPFNGEHLTSGIYFFRLMSGNSVNTRKMMLMK
jgi:hypothetical protein